MLLEKVSRVQSVESNKCPPDRSPESGSLEKCGAEVSRTNSYTMPTTRRQRLAQTQFESRVTKRGTEVESSSAKKEKEKPAISPMVMYFLMFVLFGSTVFGLIQTLTSGRQF